MNGIEITTYQAGETKFIHFVAIREKFKSPLAAKKELGRQVDEYTKSNVGGYNIFDQRDSQLSVLLVYHL